MEDKAPAKERKKSSNCAVLNLAGCVCVSVCLRQCVCVRADNESSNVSEAPLLMPQPPSSLSSLPSPLSPCLPFTCPALTEAPVCFPLPFVVFLSDVAG